jgi:hypothetical protein
MDAAAMRGCGTGNGRIISPSRLAKRRGSTTLGPMRRGHESRERTAMPSGATELFCGS